MQTLPDTLCYLNGEYTPLNQAKVSVLDRGFIFGDGIYEVVPVYGRRLFRFDEHMARLDRSLAKLRIGNPHTKVEWLARCRRLIEAQSTEDQLIYIQLTRGVALRDHVMPTDITPTVFMMVSAMKQPSAEQRHRGVACLTARDFRWERGDIKSISLLGNVLALCTEKRGEQSNLTYVGSRALVEYKLPLNEVVFDFYDRLKSGTRGYASFEYKMDGYREADLVKVSILVNAEPVDALGIIVHRTQADPRGRALCKRLRELIPRHLFQIAIQAAIGAKVIARETISAMRKDVTAKCYGGDISRKRKLLDKQKKGKKRMRQVGNVEIPQGAFIAALKMGDES